MTRVLVRCDGAAVPTDLAAAAWDQTEHIRHLGDARDLSLRLENLSHACLAAVDPRANDLVRIAAYAYAADQSVGRGGPKDVYGRRWRREFHLVVPVGDPDFWSQPAVVEPLASVLGFASEDLWNFVFVRGAPNDYQIPLALSEEELLQDPDCVALFSGGADSLSAVVEAVADHNLKPVLASHRSAPPVNARQQRLVQHLRKRLPAWCFPQISLWVHRLGGTEPREVSQRTRAFLYATLGAAIAHELGVGRVLLADNGVVSINLPITDQLVGALATRSTHPKFLRNCSGLLSTVLGETIHLVNPLALRTRAEVLQVLERHGCAPLLQETVSCAHARGRPTSHPQCGVCSQCVDRRFGVLAAGLTEHDLPERYETDVFTAALPEGPARTVAESFVRFAYDVDRQTEEDLFLAFPQLYACISPTDPTRSGQEIVRLIKRHAAQVKDVVTAQIAANGAAFFAGGVHPTSLLGMVTGGRHASEPKNDVVKRVTEILAVGLPLAFDGKTPENEPEVQRACRALFATAGERLHREVPTLPFAGISTKPDFSDCGGKPAGWFFIEMKYPKDRARLNQVITEITSRMHVYLTQGAEALFCVFDPRRVIPDDTEFINGLKAPTGTWVEIVR